MSKLTSSPRSARRDEAIAEYEKALAIAQDLQESVQGLKALQRGKP